jgi:GDPmannose 4,6-dehydratase
MKALIFGIGGQDGSYTAEMLLRKGYEVHGMLRRSSTGNTKNIEGILDKVTIHWGDLSDPLSMEKIIDDVQPDEFYNQADQDLASRSWVVPNYNYDVTGSAVGAILRILKKYPSVRYLQPISSNIFGVPDVVPQDEETPHRPQSPYACAKSMAFHLVRMYREQGVKASTAILYNHESLRRTEEYVTRKVTKAVARIKHGKQDKLFLGDLSGKIDWGWAPEFVEAEWEILQQEPDDFILATGEVHTVEDMVRTAFQIADMDWTDYVVQDKKFFRPASNGVLMGDYSKAKRTFGFDPKMRFFDIIEKMTIHDIQNPS